jgi:hypothetical protein
MEGTLYGLERSNAAECLAFFGTHRSRPPRVAHPRSIHTDTVKYTTSEWYNSLMLAILPRDVGSYSYAETRYANPSAGLPS